MIVELPLAEPVQLDSDRLAEIVARLGPGAADDVISRAMEELAVLLARAHNGYCGGNLNALGFAAGQIASLALRLGLPVLARVARDVRMLAQGRDGAALAATVARLERLGEASLMLIWDVRDKSG